MEFVRMERYRGMMNLASLVEEFYDFFLVMCRSSLEERGQLACIFLLQLGLVVTDAVVAFGLRLEAVRTFNSILDMTTREERAKLSVSEDHWQLLEQFAKVILHVGDYEMQVGLSEALCRMTKKSSREELARKWFANSFFATSFNAIRDREFEIDCRTFLNEVNTYFGDERRVYTFPAIRVFLESTELFRPEDEKLEQFWIDFNLGTFCISFFVNDPEGTLWESVHLNKDLVSSYSVRDCNDMTLLTAHLTSPITHNKTKGRTVQIVFDSQHDIMDASNRVFDTRTLMLSPPPGKQPRQSNIMDNLPSSFQSVSSARKTSPPSSAMATAGSPSIPVVSQSGSRLIETPPPQERSENAVKDVFTMKDNSDTEVARGLARYFSLSASPNRASQSNLKDMKKQRAKRSPHGEAGSGMAQGKHDYTRKKTKTKSRLKILPMSSPSSGDNSPGVKLSSPARESLESTPRKSSAEELFDKLQEESPESPSPSKLKFIDSGLHDVSKLDDSVFARQEQDTSTSKVYKRQEASTTRKRPFETTGRAERMGTEIKHADREPEKEREPPVSRPHVHFSSVEESTDFPDVAELEDSGFHWQKQDTSTPQGYVSRQEASIPRKRPSEITGLSEGAGAERKREYERELPGLRPRTLFGSLGEATETMTRALTEDIESDAEMGSEVMTAFQSFKTQLRKHFSSRYKRIEARSLQSLTDCQKNVTSLLSTVHHHRLVHLERFQATVVQELGQLESNCLTLKAIEKETVNFWQSESRSVRTFCDRQERRLMSFGDPAERGRSSMSQRDGSTAPSAPPK